MDKIFINLEEKKRLKRKVDYWAAFWLLMKDMVLGALGAFAFLAAIWTAYVW